MRLAIGALYLLIGSRMEWLDGIQVTDPDEIRNLSSGLYRLSLKTLLIFRKCSPGFPPLTFLVSIQNIIYSITVFCISDRLFASWGPKISGNRLRVVLAIRIRFD